MITMTENESMSIMVTSGTEDKLMALGTITLGAVTMDVDVHIFLAFWGLEAFRKGAPTTNPTSMEGEPYDEIMDEYKEQKSKKLEKNPHVDIHYNIKVRYVSHVPRILSYV